MKEYFKRPTNEQKKQLAILQTKLRGFNIVTFMYRVRKKEGYLPPIESIIKISKSAIKTKPLNMWGYFSKALSQELPKHFANLNIEEAKRLKNEPSIMGEIMRRVNE